MGRDARLITYPNPKLPLNRSKFALMLAGLCIGLLLGEAVLLFLAPQVRRIPRLWEYDRELGWKHIPHARGRMVTPEFDVEIAINADGLRDRDFAKTRQPQSWRLLALGDSFVEGWGVELGSSVTKVLEGLLQARMAETVVEVVNMGVAGYGTDQELLFYERLGTHYQPDDVLVFFYVNDFWNNASPVGIGSEQGYKPFFRLGPGGRLSLRGIPVPRLPSWDADWHATRPWRQRLRRYMRRNCHLYALAERALFPSRGELVQRQRFYRGLYGRDPGGQWQTQWELCGHLLEALDTRVELAGAKLHVVYVPAMVQIEEANWHRKKELNQLVGEYDLARPNRQLATLAARHGLSYLDLHPVFRRHSGQRRLYFRDSHWNKNGHAVAAAAIADFLMAARAR